MYKYPTGSERMVATIEDMEDIPAGSNPFMYDDFSMGTTLLRGITIMHPGFDSEDNPRALEWFYIYNSRSGQRLRIVLTPKEGDNANAEL